MANSATNRFLHLSRPKKTVQFGTLLWSEKDRWHREHGHNAHNLWGKLDLIKVQSEATRARSSKGNRFGFWHRQEPESHSMEIVHGTCVECRAQASGLRATANLFTNNEHFGQWWILSDAESPWPQCLQAAILLENLHALVGSIL